MVAKAINRMMFVLIVWSTACGAPATLKNSPEVETPSVAQQQKSEIALSWTREGGFAGFCDEMQVLASGDVRTRTCRGNAENAGKLTSDDLSRLSEWRASFGRVMIDSRDGAVADGMTITLTLNGTGNKQPTEEQRREILQWAQRVYDRK